MSCKVRKEKSDGDPKLPAASPRNHNCAKFPDAHGLPSAGRVFPVASMSGVSGLCEERLLRGRDWGPWRPSSHCRQTNIPPPGPGCVPSTPPARRRSTYSKPAGDSPRPPRRKLRLGLRECEPGGHTGFQDSMWGSWAVTFQGDLGQGQVLLFRVQRSLEIPLQLHF